MKYFINDVFDKYEIEEVYRDYILENSNILPQDIYIWSWDQFLVDLSQNLDLDDKYMLKIYQIIMKSDKLSHFTDFLYTKFDDKKLEGFETYTLVTLKAIELLTKAGNDDIFDIYYKLINASSLYSDSVIDNMNKNNSKEDIIKNLRSYTLDHATSKILSELYKIDADSFSDFIIEIFYA